MLYSAYCSVGPGTSRQCPHQFWVLAVRWFRLCAPPPLGRLGSPCSHVSALKGAGRAGVLGSRPTPNMHSSFMRAYKCLLSWRYLVLWLYNVNGLSLLACPSSSLSFPILSLSTLLSCPSGVPSWTGSFWRTLRADLLCRIQWP